MRDTLTLITPCYKLLIKNKNMSKLLEEMCPKIYDNPSYKAGLRQGRLEGLREGGDHVLKEMTKEDKIKEKVLESDLPFEIK